MAAQTKFCVGTSCGMYNTKYFDSPGSYETKSFFSITVTFVKYNLLIASKKYLLKWTNSSYFRMIIATCLL